MRPGIPAVGDQASWGLHPDVDSRRYDAVLQGFTVNPAAGQVVLEYEVILPFRNETGHDHLPVPAFRIRNETAMRSVTALEQIPRLLVVERTYRIRPVQVDDEPALHIREISKHFIIAVAVSADKDRPLPSVQRSDPLEDGLRLSGACSQDPFRVVLIRETSGSILQQFDSEYPFLRNLYPERAVTGDSRDIFFNRRRAYIRNDSVGFQLGIQVFHILGDTKAVFGGHGDISGFTHHGTRPGLRRVASLGEGICRRFTHQGLELLDCHSLGLQSLQPQGGVLVRDSPDQCVIHRLQFCPEIQVFQSTFHFLERFPEKEPVIGNDVVYQSPDGYFPTSPHIQKEVRTRKAACQEGEHLVRNCAVFQFLDLVVEQGVLDVADYGSIVEIEHCIWLAGRIIVRRCIPDPGYHFREAGIDRRRPAVRIESLLSDGRLLLLPVQFYDCLYREMV